MVFTSLITKLKAEISTLPGHEAHKLAAPLQRKSTVAYLQENPSYKTSCVTIILFPEDDITRILLMERADNTSSHGGQISFPGGRREHDDITLLDTALREMYEEVGIRPSDVRIIGQLSELYIPVSNYLVHPFVGYTERRPDVNLNPAEVKSILFPDLELFLSGEKQTGTFESRTFGPISAPYFPYEGHRIWGATAMVISELAFLINR